MNKISVKELSDVIKYIVSRWLEKQYRKAKDTIQSWNRQKLDFKLRQPKKYEVYQFRINKKYRAFWIFRETEKYGKIFLVTEISDHQDF